jgi:uncharacterized membrane protein
MLALASACFSAVSTTLIQKGLRRSNFYAGFWINVVVGMLGLWTVVLLVVPRTEYHWRAVPYFILSGVVGTAGGRLFRVVAIEKVGAPVAAAINNLSPFIPTVSPLLTPVASRNLLLYQSLPIRIPYRQAKLRRRNDDTSVGTATRSITEGLHRFSRRVQPHGGPSRRVRRALSRGS